MRRTITRLLFSVAISGTFIGGGLASPAEAGLNVTTGVCPSVQYSVTPGPGPGQLTVHGSNTAPCTVVTQNGAYSIIFNAVLNSVGSVACTGGVAEGPGDFTTSFPSNITIGVFAVMAGNTIL